MKNFIATPLFLVFTLFLSACVTPIEHVQSDLRLDGWKVGYSKDTPGKGNIVEFVPSNESVEVWSKLITIQFFEGSKEVPNEFMFNLRGKMRSRCPDVEWNVIREKRHEILYEWMINDCSGTEAQHEIAKLLKGNDGLHRFSYVEKTRILGEKERQYWIDAISNAYLVKGDSIVDVQ